MSTETIKSGKYTFQLTEDVEYYDGEIYYKMYKITGNIKDCIEISVNYFNKQQNPEATFINLAYDPKCSKGVDLDKGNGSRIMVKAAISHIARKNPLVKEFNFQDSSEIDCTESLSKLRRNNKISLFYFSMAFNEQTWYEKHFGARQKTSAKHERYRQRLNSILHSPELKPTYRHLREKVMVDADVMNETTYNTHSTLSEVFESIPQVERCNHASNWIVGIMEILMKSYVKNDGWIIPVVQPEIRGSRKYYCPKGVRLQETGQDRCIEKA
jgi:hypothetical protein